jgi:hypothetical protein
MDVYQRLDPTGQKIHEYRDSTAVTS